MKFFKQKLYSWRFYGLGREAYQRCMEKSFANNLLSLRQANTVLAILAFCFSAFPMFVENNFPKAGIYFGVAAIAVFHDLVARYMDRRETPVSRRKICAQIGLYYTNVMLFGIYLGVWSNPEALAATFMGILVVALLLFITPPTFNLSLSVCALIIFAVSTFLVKDPRHWIFDIVNALIACLLSLIFGWRMNTYRLSAVLFSLELEEERNKYYSQSTVDELTQLHNRRFFMQTFQRYLTSHRDTDEWLCLAMLDVDYFKKYNDAYGHPKGDEVLRALGGVLNGIQDGMGVFAARIGGEEFALLWFEKDLDGGGKPVAHLLKQVEELNIPHMESDVAPRVTVSVGVYISRCGAPNALGDIYSAADKALYEAKQTGRNRVVVRGGLTD
ncbi:MAG: GGDEF domain-containing protein [Oscillospiraceae bacterium]|nr:GGDEF domain-containing protein [Oscillospiraceae bacterium]